MFRTITNELTIRAAVPAADIPNPIGTVKPDIKVFGVQFENAFQLIAAGVWGLALLLVAIAFLWNLAKWGLAKRRGHADDIEDGSEGAKRTGIAFGALAAASLIIGAILALVNMMNNIPAAGA